MLKNILWEDIRRNINQYLIVVCVYTLMIVFFNQMIQIENKVLNRQDRYERIASQEFIRIAFNQDYTPLYDQPKSLQYLKLMHEKLRTAEEFHYYEINDQFLYILNYDGAPIFREMYEDGNPYREDIVMEINGTKYPPAATIKSVQLSLNCFSHFDLKIMEGEGFKEEDYIYKINDIVPVILGYDYREQYEIGQDLQGIYIAEPFTFRVIGFLEENSYLQVGANIKYLDRYMIIPFFNCENPVNLQDKIFQIRHYGLKTSGFILPLEERIHSNIENIINHMAKECNLEEYSIWSIRDNGINHSKIADQLHLGLIALIVMFIAASATFMVVIFNKKIIRDKDIYWAYMVSGLNISIIRKIIQLQILAVLIVSDCLNAAMQILFFKPSLYNNIINLIVSLFIFIITGFTINQISLKKLLLKHAGEEF